MRLQKLKNFFKKENERRLDIFQFFRNSFSFSGFFDNPLIYWHFSFFTFRSDNHGKPEPFSIFSR